MVFAEKANCALRRAAAQGVFQRKPQFIVKNYLTISISAFVVSAIMFTLTGLFS